MLRIIQDLWNLGVETYDSLENDLHNTLIRRKCMKIKIIRKCRNGNFELKYFDNQLNCWLSSYESEANLRQGISEGVFQVEDSTSASTSAATDNSLLAQARAASTVK